MKIGKAVTFGLNLAKEKKRARFADAFQRELSRNRLAEQIAALREKHGWTQAELARKVGTTQSGIARLENPDYRNYSLKTLEKVAMVLNARLVVGLEEIRQNAAYLRRPRASPMLPAVTKAKHVRSYLIQVKFNDGTRKVIDFKQWLTGPIFKPLRNKEYFKKFFVDGPTIAWPNGADIAPETLYDAPEVEAASDQKVRRTG